MIGKRALFRHLIYSNEPSDLHGDSLQENKVMAQKRNDVSDLEGVIFGAGGERRVADSDSFENTWRYSTGKCRGLAWLPFFCFRQVRAMLDGWPTVMKIEDAEPFVLNNKKQGAKCVYLWWSYIRTDYSWDRYVKVFNESGLSMGIDSPRPSFEVLKAVVDSAHKHGMIAVAHATTYENTMEVLYAGIDGLVHGFIDRPISEEMISLFKRNNAFMSPTFAVIEGVIDQNIDEHVEAMEKSGRKHLLDEHSRTHQHCGLGFRGEGASSKYAYEAVTKLREAGVDICWRVGLLSNVVESLPCRVSYSGFRHAHGRLQCGCWPLYPLRTPTVRIEMRLHAVRGPEIRHGT